MKRFCILLLPLLVITACGPSRVPPPKTAQSYYSEGETFFDKGLYAEAIASWEKVRESFHSPELTALAELKIAESHFEAGDYTEAAAAYEDFLKQHPGHEKTPEILYRLGMSYYSQVLSIDRDQTATQNALVTFQTLIDRFPDHPKAKEAAPFVRKALDNLAEHELYVGSFYLKTDQNNAAVRRLEKLFQQYPDFYKRDQAYFVLGQAYLKAGREKEAVETFNALYQNFPDSGYILPAQKILEKNL